MAGHAIHCTSLIAHNRCGLFAAGVPGVLSPQLLQTLASMGHGDALVISDANFPAESVAKSNSRLAMWTALRWLIPPTARKEVIRADGHDATAILDAVLTLFPLDTFVAGECWVLS